MTVIKLAPQAMTAADAARICREVADWADKGEVVGVSILYEKPGAVFGTYLSQTRNRTSMAGALLDAALLRLGYVSKQEN